MKIQKPPVSHLSASQASRYMLEERGIKITSQSISTGMNTTPPRVPFVEVFGVRMIPVKFLERWWPRPSGVSRPFGGVHHG